ncbi:uncharacterized protein FIBRA_05549 [Fibroporia radiculosa]|uniref:F-box domain-containing protein n=1 Tax=Fibroporia radiculosa TaxID=599839 RepID=J4G9P9_9APHY|nr:uncharacterized protein FIBRA_05549 [Fibroporia radiculosa]CCM03418.1 predicted protein [Fibroporia radiculosa]
MTFVPATLILPLSPPHNGVPLELEVVAEAGEIHARGDRGGAQSPSAFVATRGGHQRYDLLPGRSIGLPTEVWWKVIDFVADDIWHTETGGNQLRELARVNQACHTRCRVRAEERLDVIDRDKKEVYRLIRRLDEHPDRYGRIKTVRFVNGKISTFGSLAILMAGKLPNVEMLELKSGSLTWFHCDWEPGQLHSRIFLHVRAAFESVTTLHLFWILFPSAAVFGRLIHALPRLGSLTCNGVRFKNPSVMPGPVASPLRLATVGLFESPDVVDFLVQSGPGAFFLHQVVVGPQRGKGSRLVTVAAHSLSSFHLRIDWSIAQDLNDLDLGLLPDLTPAQNLCALSVSISSISFSPQWLERALPRASLPNLRELEISVDLQGDDQRRSNFDEFDDDSYVHIDGVLSGPLFPTLQKITFCLQCCVTPSEVMSVTSEVSWRTHFSSKLPLLHASGRLL